MPHLAFKGKFGVFFSLIRRSKSISTTRRNVKMQTISQIFNWYKDKFDYTTSEFSLLVLGIITDEIYIYIFPKALMCQENIQNKIKGPVR